MERPLRTLVVVVGLTALLVAGCSAPSAHSEESPKEFFQTKYQKLPDGRTVLCLYREGYATGYADRPAVMSCDWAGAIVHP